MIPNRNNQTPPLKNSNIIEPHLEPTVNNTKMATSTPPLIATSTAPRITPTPTPTPTPSSSSSSPDPQPQQTTTFTFPPEHSFPPFYTRQPNQSTRRSQHQKWAAIILSYCAFHKLYKLSLSSPASETLFHNASINRRLSTSDAREVLEFMRRDGRAEFGGDGEADVVWVYWRTPDEWAALLEGWVDDTAMRGTVFTLYELSKGEDTLGTGLLFLFEIEFHGLDLDLLQKALQVLVKRGKAQIFGQEDQLGVKFF
ncbi:vacuolar protein-sorting-associated protein [Xylaria nigripes]|nr:vacuolar protein-sorting-associated protein [Xylaria nigripes]